MKNENLNLINVLLVVAIVLAVGGTWLNLNKLGDVKQMTLVGYATGGVSEAAYMEYLQAWTTSEPLTFHEFVNYGTMAGLDCYITTDGTQPGTHTDECITTGGNATGFVVNLTTNTATNVSAYYTKNISTNFGGGSLNHQWVGKVIISDLNGGTNNAAGWLNADNNHSTAPVLLLEDVNELGPQNFQVNISHGIEIDPLTPTGSYTNTLNVMFSNG